MNQRDLELLSAYLDGELNPSDSARLEARLKTNPEFESVLNDLRAARTLLRKLPKRRAPRNFTLTRKMVGLNPPLPRSYPVFRLVTAVATMMFFLTFGVNVLAPQFQQPIGVGGGGADQTELFSAQESEATEEPAMEAAANEAPAEAVATEAPAAIESPGFGSGLAPQPTLGAQEESARVADTPVAKAAEEDAVELQSQPQADGDASFIPSIWLVVFAVIAILSAIFMALIRLNSANRWK